MVMPRKAKSGPSKMEALRGSLETNGWKADNIVHQQFIRDTYGIEMTLQQISQYKSNERRRTGKRRRRRRKGVEEGAPATAGPRGASSDSVLQFVSTVRKWEDKLGSKKLLAVIEALYRKG